MDIVQTWLLIGFPGLCIVAGLFVGRSILRAWLGYGVLAALILVFVFTPSGGLSAALLGAIVIALVATGRGSHRDRALREHHEDRDRFTQVTAE